MKKMKKLSAILLVVFVFFASMMTTAFAADVTQDGLEVSLITDKEAYNQGEQIAATLTVKNTNDFAVKNVTLEELIPDGYVLADGATATKELESLEPGATAELAVTFVAKGEIPTDPTDPTDPTEPTDPTDTEDPVDPGFTDNGLWKIVFPIMGVTGFVAIIIALAHFKKFLALLLAAIIGGSFITGGMFKSKSFDEQKSINVSETVKVNKEDKEIRANVYYDDHHDKDEPDYSREITREEWIVALFDALEFDEPTDEQFSYDDYTEASSPYKIDAFVRREFIPLSPDGDNMVFFKPKETATREFAAYTAVHALEYQIENGKTPEWADANDLNYPAEDLLSVNADIMYTIKNHFYPNKAFTANMMSHALAGIEKIISRTHVEGNEENVINYADGVKEIHLVYDLNEETKTVYTNEIDKVKGLEQGKVYVLKSEDGSQKDIAVKVVEVKVENGTAKIVYEEPKLEEVVTEFNISGVTKQGGAFIPAEGVTVESNMGARTRAAVDGSIPLFGKKEIGFKIGEVEFKGVLNFKNLEYRFAASPSWHLVTIDEVYLALNMSQNFSVKGELSNNELVKQKIGSIQVPLGYGFFAAGDLYVVASAKGTFRFEFEVTEKAGIQYAKNQGIRSVYDMNASTDGLFITGEAKSGIDATIGAEFLGINIVSLGADSGVGILATANIISPNPFKICVDGTTYFYLGVRAQIGWDDLNLKYDRELCNSDKSVLKENIHIEETGIVSECTRGHGDYQGYVRRADNSVPIVNAKVQVVKDGRVKATNYSDSNGYFKGAKLSQGSYTLRVSAVGFRPYEQTFQIVGGNTTSLETQLMISNEQAGGEDRFTCSGMITNAYTGGAVSGATISVYSKFLFGGGELVAKVTSQSNGQYNFDLPIGYYEVVVEKDGFTKNAKQLWLTKNTDNFYISLNPENMPSFDGNLRVVLRWGDTPRDLDSHMVGPTDNGTFHVFYSHMSSGDVSLDVDDTTSYGPETITMSQTKPGVYSYYIHDYTNRSSSNSNGLSNSGAYVQLYADNTLMYTINVPQDQGGTLWHVFDYNSETDQIQLVNEFTYQSDPWYVGSRNSFARRASVVPPKDYEQ